MILKSTGGWYHKEEPVYSVLKYVQDDEGKHLGTIVLFVRETSFSDVLANTEDTQNRQFYLVSQNNEIISSVEKEDLYQNAETVLGLTATEYQTCLE